MFCDVIFTLDKDDEPCKSPENETRQEFAPSIFHVQKLLHVAGNQLLLLISSFYVGLHFVV
jgi:hypothetical protein